MQYRSNNNKPNPDSDDNNIVNNTLEATNEKHLVFSDVTAIFPSNTEINLAQRPQLTVKPILKKTTAGDEMKKSRGKR